MCITYDQIDEACGYLLLRELNKFVYCCKVCRGEFETGPYLESHILSEHEDDKGSVCVNDGLLNETTSTNDSQIEIVPAIVKIEHDDPSYLVDDGINNEYNDISTEVIAPPRRRGRPRGSTKNKNVVVVVHDKLESENRRTYAEIFNDQNRRSQQLESMSSDDEPTEVNVKMENDPTNRVSRFENWHRDECNSGNNFGHGSQSIGRRRSGRNRKSNQKYNDDDSSDTYGGTMIKRPRGRPIGSKDKKKRAAKINGSYPRNSTGRPIGAKDKMKRAAKSYESFTKKPAGRPIGSKDKTKRAARPYESYSRKSTGRPIGSKDKKKRATKSYKSFRKESIERPNWTPYNDDSSSYGSTSTGNHTQPDFVNHNQTQHIDFGYGELSNAGDSVPFKIKTETPTAKRPRGRPLGRRNTMDGDSTSNDNRNDVIDESIEANQTCPTVQKRRGRPKKQNSNGDVLIELKTEHTMLKRSRGRPRKNQIKIEFDESVPKRPRGRPPKIITNNQNINNTCKPFEIKLEDIYTSGQFRNWLDPTNRNKD